MTANRSSTSVFVLIPDTFLHQKLSIQENQCTVQIQHSISQASPYPFFIDSHWTEIEYRLTVSLSFLFLELKYHFAEHNEKDVLFFPKCTCEKTTGNRTFEKLCPGWFKNKTALQIFYQEQCTKLMRVLQSDWIVLFRWSWLYSEIHQPFQQVDFVTILILLLLFLNDFSI